MTKKKEAKFLLRIDEDLLELVKIQAEEEKRSINNMINVLVERVFNKE